MSKSLGKTESKLLSRIGASGKMTFGLHEARRVTRTSYDATRLLAANLVRKGWLLRLKKGTYLILSLLDEIGTLKSRYQAAAALIGPSPYYFSHYSAFSLHGMTTQPIKTLYVSSPRRLANRTILKTTIKFIYCPPEKMWGIEEKWIDKQNKVKISDKEKTILDSLSRTDLSGGLSEIAKAIWLKRNELDYQKLLLYSKQLKIEAVSRRLGFILELYGLGSQKIYSGLKGKSASFPLLDPTLPKKGFYLKEWHLLVNSDPEELKKIIWT